MPLEVEFRGKIPAKTICIGKQEKIKINNLGLQF